MNIRDFHNHLDCCSKCRNEPFNLCAVGEQLIKEAVGPCSHGHCLHPPKCVGVGAPDERDPLGCCNCGTRELEKTALAEGKVEPHFYVETTPYKGCATCGIGPGAFHHNEHEVKRFLQKEEPSRRSERKAFTTGKLPCSLCGRTRPPLPTDEVKTRSCSFGCGYPLPASDDARAPKKDPT